MTHDELRFRVNRNLQPRLKAYVSARGIHMTGAQKQVAVQNRDYVAAETGCEWQITRSFRLAGAYNYTWQRFQGEPTADSNAFTISIVWQPLSRFEVVSPMTVPNQTLPNH
jgi:hypothetical protein